MISTDSVSGRLSRWQPGNWSLPVKLAVVLAVPIILAVTLGVLRVSDQIRYATDLGDRDRYLVLEEKVSTLVGRLQRERDQSAVFVVGNRTGDRSVLKSVFGEVDGGLRDTDAAIGNPASLGGGPEAAYRQAKDNLARLTALRDQVVVGPLDAPGVVARYTGMIEPLLVLASSLDRQLNTPALAGLASGLSALNSAREQVALQHVVIAVAIGRGEMLPPDADTVRATDARLGTAVDQFRAGLDARQQQRLAGWATSQADGQRKQLKQQALSRIGARGQLGISMADWDAAYESVLEELRTAESGLRDEVEATSTAQQEQARDAAGISSVILLLGILATAAVVYLIGRSLLRPLRVLRRSALEIADRQLPEAVQGMREGRSPDTTVTPVPVTSKEEIGQVARAFDAVHGQALRLAAEQATLQTNISSMFVNLSRRSQGLVERQLQLIEELERNEQDSEQLANLFQLDHLATRMRRNSENLLVLAGSDLAKRGNQPVPVVDVLRAAVSEIEQYQRVVVQTPPDLEIVGRAASDLVHLVAELLDNATTFSAPDTQVVVSSTRTPDGSVLVEIADQGVGMAGEELISANNRLAGPTDVNVSTSRRMGLFVVGRLAARHGIGVRLASSDPSRGASSGVTASVNVPNYLVAGALSGTEALEAVRASRASSGRPEEAFSNLTGSAGGVNGTAGAAGNGRSWGGPGSLPGAPSIPSPSAPPSGGGSASSPSASPSTASPNGRPAGAGDLPSRTPGRAVAASGGLPPVPTRGAATGPGTASPPAGSTPPPAAGPPPGATGPPPVAGDAAPPAPTSATPTSATPPAAGGAAPPADGGLPRRSAGASLAGPLAPNRQSPPPSRGQSPAPSGESGTPAVESSGPLPRRVTRPGGLRSPDGLRSLRTPASLPIRDTAGPRTPDGPRDSERPRTPDGPRNSEGPRAPDSARSTDGPRDSAASRAPDGPPAPDGRAPGVNGAPSRNGGPGPGGEHPAHAPASDAPAAPDLPRRDRPGLPRREGSDLPRRERKEPPPRDGSGPPRRERPVPPAAARSSVPPAAAPVPPARTESDQPGESPIFEEMASAWFRENWEAPSPNEARLAPGPEVPAPPLPPGDGDGWDSGEPLLTPFTSAGPSELTSAGLPKRQRGSQLIPGGPAPRQAPQSAAPAETPSPFGASVPVRSAERVRGRLASYQQGVRQGRQSRHRAPDPDDVRASETFEEM